MNDRIAEAYEAGEASGKNESQSRIRALEEQLRSARRALGQAAKVFRLYEDIHRSKGDPEAERKARDNAELARAMEAALVDTEAALSATFNSDIIHMTKAEAEVRLKDEITLIRKSIAMPATRNAEQDDAVLWDAARSTAMIAAGFCPNGCGILVSQDGYTKACLGCGFFCRGYV